MSSTTNIETTDVVICGCGPTGAMLSVLLAKHGVRNVVLEREESVNTDPRGIALDEDGIRCLQACGIYDKVFTNIGQYVCGSISLSWCFCNYFMLEEVREMLTCDNGRYGRVQVHQRRAQRA
jgi:choline dehydrogenase-like flavoprotein